MSWPTLSVRLEELPESFRASVEVLSSGCWRWTGQSAKEGYGRYSVNGRRIAAHRWAWIYLNGDVPAGKDMDHYLYPQDGCIGPSCANPDHVRPETPAVNALRGDGPCARNARKSHCQFGHLLSDDNLYIIPSTGSRVCRICQREKQGWQGGTSPGDRTSCPSGHAYDEANTYVAPNGGRHCRACRKEKARLKRAASAGKEVQSVLADSLVS